MKYVFRLTYKMNTWGGNGQSYLSITHPIEVSEKYNFYTFDLVIKEPVSWETCEIEWNHQWIKNYDTERKIAYRNARARYEAEQAPWIKPVQKAALLALTYEEIAQLQDGSLQAIIMDVEVEWDE